MIEPAPWDSAALGRPAWELTEYSEAALLHADGFAGHQSIKVDPLADKQALQRHAFYYCDTLLQTGAGPAQLRPLTAPEGIAISSALDADAALAICHGAFVHGRYHRDFNVPAAGADRRYDNWLGQLLEAHSVFGLYADGQLAGFIGYSGNQLVLHAVAAQFRGRGLGKYWWRLAVLQLFGAGHAQVGSSISASNIAALNLYASLGFSFNHPQDVYHRLVP
jgi:GNAT superfamily N-acetyltransferase